MSQADRYIPGVPCWVDCTQPDPAAAAAFYGELFGWALEDVMPPGAPVPYYMARIRGEDVAGIAGTAEDAPAGGAVWNTYVWVTDAEETAGRVRAAGGTVVAEPSDVGDWGRMAVFADPAGAGFRAWQPLSHRGATVVNEHGAVNFNDLRTTDVDGAAAFYGAVFGWEVIPVGDGHAWALPAYGDFLEARTPGMRENMARMGAPERFEEVVATLSRADEGEAPAWGVAFGIDDADAVAARATELGGELITPPFDAPWVRSTVLADPAGAAFSANQFVPPS
jgi:predicted enzyme related to lactoylglutathione lyase